MDEKKSPLTHNQAAEKTEPDFQFVTGVTEDTSNATTKQYNRDILLQLRLHPLSLQKPSELPEMDVIKHKLYLNNITDMTSNSPEKHVDTNNYRSSTKPDYCSMKSDVPLLSPYLNRVYPYCYSSHAYNGPYQSPPLKCRSSYNNYCNSLKKHCMATHQCLKDFSMEECSWMKHFPSSDDMWNCYSNYVHSGTYKRKEHQEVVPKSRKKLPIIDPVTGKNVLETVNPNQLEQSSVGENSKAVKDPMANKEICGDYFDNTKENHDEDTLYRSTETSYDSACGDKSSFEEFRDSNAEFQTDVNAKSIKDNLEQNSNTLSAGIDCTDVETENQKDGNESPDVKNNSLDFTKTCEKAHKYDASKYSKQVLKNNHNTEINSHFDVHGTCRAHSIKECHMHVCNENISKQHDTMQESLRQLKEKIYSLKQEEQKVAILQSFLRYKKYQLEESARNLDEKRIEIANWEYNLYNKAKRLQEKEQWLENKNEVLNNKTQQLVEKEKILNEDDNKNSSDSFYLNTFKETEISEKKFAFDNNDTIWNEISKMKNPRNNENNEYSSVRYDSKSSKVPENVEKCKSDAFSLDELEKNLVFIEKMHSDKEVNDSSVNKVDLASSNTIKKSDDNASYDPLGYSKGRRYLPEHIKYWLDKRDKNAA